MSIVLISSCSSSCLSSRIHSRRHGSNLPFSFNLSRLLLRNQSSPFSILNLKDISRRRNHVTAIYSGEPLGVPPPLPSDPSSGSWKLWIVGMLISAILPFWKNKWWPLLRIKQTVEEVVDAAEEVAEMVETVAESVEKVADEVADHLPEGGKLQKVALFVENVARRAARDADLVGDVIDKVEEMENEVESLFEEQADPKNEERLKEEEEEEEAAKEKEGHNLKGTTTTTTTTTATKKESILEDADQGKGKYLKEESKVENDDQKVKDKSKPKED